MAINHDHDKRLRAAELVKKTVLEGKTKKQAAKEMGIHPDTVERTLSWAREANIFVEYEQRLFTELLPLAHDAIKLAIEDGDAQVALKIFEMVGFSGKDRSKSKAAQENDEGLYGEIARLRAGSVINVTPTDSGLRQLPAIESAGTTIYDVPISAPAGGIHRIQENTPVEGEDRQQDRIEADET